MKNIPDRGIIFQRCIFAGACKPEFNKLVAAETYEKFWTVLIRNYGWCFDNNILKNINHPKNYDFITTLAHVDLRHFNGDLKNLKTIRGDAYLNYFSGTLPTLKTIGGDAILRGCSSDFPKLQTIGRKLYINGFTGILPKLETVFGIPFNELNTSVIR